MFGCCCALLAHRCNVQCDPRLVLGGILAAAPLQRERLNLREFRKLASQKGSAVLSMKRLWHKVFNLTEAALLSDALIITALSNSLLASATRAKEFCSAKYVS